MTDVSTSKTTSGLDASASPSDPSPSSTKTTSLPHSPLSFWQIPVRLIVRASTRTLLNTWIRVKARGLETIPAEGPLILASNHVSHLDGPAIVKSIGQRRVWSVAAEDYFFDTALKSFVFGKVFDTLPFDRRATGLKGLKTCVGTLLRGDAVLIFPEGTRSKDGRLQAFKPGLSLLAHEVRAPVIPVHVDGSFRLMKKGMKWPRPGRLDVVFGPPILPLASEGKVDHREFAHRVREAVQALGESNA